MFGPKTPRTYRAHSPGNRRCRAGSQFAPSRDNLLKVGALLSGCDDLKPRPFAWRIDKAGADVMIWPSPMPAAGVVQW